jgi:hypothetical protein
LNAASSTGGVTAELEAVMERLHRACLTMACLPADGPRGFYSTWPRYKLTWWDPGNEDSKLSAADITRRFIAPPHFTPTPKEVDDCLPALALLDGLGWLHRRVLRLRAHQLWYGEHAGADEEYAHWRGGWRMIGAECGVSHEMARRLHWQCVVKAFERSALQAATSA